MKTEQIDIYIDGKMVKQLIIFKMVMSWFQFCFLNMQAF